MTRKPIQIAAIPATDEGSELLFALCDDGSIWSIQPDQLRPDTWKRLPDIPNAKPIGSNRALARATRLCGC
jgi:hypothetical protein